MRLQALLLSLLCALPILANAQPPYPGPLYPRESPALPNPAGLVREGLDKLLAVSAQVSHGTDPRALLPRLREEIAPYIDFAYMADWVAGPYKRQMGPAQRREFAVHLQQRFLAALAQRLSGGQGYSYRLLPPQSHRGETDVGVQVLQYNRPLHRVNFRLYWDGQGWKMFDVVADGSSALQYYRQDFNEQVARQGLGAWAERP
jgi:phospholipid transport system substrate-binding protein